LTRSGFFRLRLRSCLHFPLQAIIIGLFPLMTMEVRELDLAFITLAHAGRPNLVGVACPQLSLCTSPNAGPQCWQLDTCSRQPHLVLLLLLVFIFLVCKVNGHLQPPLCLLFQLYLCSGARSVPIHSLHRQHPLPQKLCPHDL
jgi:hypothetical protein